MKAGVLPKNMRNKILTARPSSALDTRASVNSPQHLRDQEQSNITVQRDAEGGDPPGPGPSAARGGRGPERAG